MNEIPRNNIKIYRSDYRHGLGFFNTYSIMFENIIRSRELIWQLFKRDFHASYKKSFIGTSWIFISPVVGIISWVFLNMTGLLKPGDVNIPYPAYVLAGSTMWGLFMGFFNSARATLLSGKDLILQVNYPHEVLLFKETAQHLANFLIALIITIIVLLVYNVDLSWKIILFPLVALPLFFLGAAIGLVFSMISIVSIDINKMAEIGISFIMYLTPIIYSNQVNNTAVQTIIKWNPLTYLVCAARDIIIYGTINKPEGYIICSILSFLIFMMSWRLFFISEDKIIERMI